VFRGVFNLLSLFVVAHDAASALLASPHPAVDTHVAASLAHLTASRLDLPSDVTLLFLK
jgi:hypothetical protein